MMNSKILLASLLITSCSGSPTAVPAPTPNISATVNAAVSAAVATAVVSPATPAPTIAATVDAPKPTMTPVATATATQSSKPSGADAVISAFKAAGLPIGEFVVFTDEADPNKFLGRPGQYIGKATWKDTRIKDEKNIEVIAGGGIEIFPTLESLKPRKALLDETSKIPLLAEYVYQNDKMILRLSHKLTPSQAKAYEDVFMKLK